MEGVNPVATAGSITSQPTRTADAVLQAEGTLTHALFARKSDCRSWNHTPEE